MRTEQWPKKPFTRAHRSPFISAPFVCGGQHFIPFFLVFRVLLIEMRWYVFLLTQLHSARAQIRHLIVINANGKSMGIFNLENGSLLLLWILLLVMQWMNLSVGHWVATKDRPSPEEYICNCRKASSAHTHAHALPCVGVCRFTFASVCFYFHLLATVRWSGSSSVLNPNRHRNASNRVAA